MPEKSKPTIKPLGVSHLIQDSSNLPIEESVLETDVCILGGGVAGLTLALEMRNLAKDLIILEGGGRSFDTRSQELYTASKENRTQYPDPRFSRLRFLGGSSNHWANNTSPLDPFDFEVREDIPHTGWPITHQELAPYYSAASRYCGLGNDDYSIETWSLRLKSKDPVEGSDILATGIAKAAVPATRFFERWGDGLTNARNVRIITNANVCDMGFEPLNGIVDTVQFASKEGVQFKVHAKFFVMCLGGIENARMLLFFNKNHKDAIGNQNDLVGRFFMDHPMVRGALFYPNNPESFNLYRGGDFDNLHALGYMKLNPSCLVENRICNVRMPLEPVSRLAMSDGVSSLHIISKEIGDFSLPDEIGQHVANIARDIDMVGEALSRKFFGAELFDSADEVEAYYLAMMTEQTPNRNNRIFLGPDLDVYGVPKIKIEWRVSEEDRVRLWRALEIAGREIGRLGLGRLRLLRERSSRLWGDQLGFGHHHMGTTRMGFDSESGVVDRDLRVFGTQNLFVSGSSVFPTGGHVPPTLTIAALSIRLASHLRDS